MENWQGRGRQQASPHCRHFTTLVDLDLPRAVMSSPLNERFALVGWP